MFFNANVEMPIAAFAYFDEHVSEKQFYLPLVDSSNRARYPFNVREPGYVILGSDCGICTQNAASITERNWIPAECFIG